MAGGAAGGGKGTPVLGEGVHDGGGVRHDQEAQRGDTLPLAASRSQGEVGGVRGSRPGLCDGAGTHEVRQTHIQVRKEWMEGLG